MARIINGLGVFRSDSGITLSFGKATYFISANEPFHNIALKALDQNDYIPFYLEIAKRERVGRNSVTPSSGSLKMHGLKISQPEPAEAGRG